MTMHAPIFGAAFAPQKDVRTDPAAVQAFLESVSRDRTRDAQARSLADYRLLIADAASFWKRGVRSDLGAYVRYGALDHARIARDELRDAVELYSCHLHELSSIDLRHPTEFIRTSEATIARLDPKKLNDVIRMARLREMVEARKAQLAQLEKRRTGLEVELQRIAWYIWENLRGIERLTETAAGRLADPAIGEAKERKMIEEIKVYVKERVKSELSEGRLTTEGLARAKQEFDDLSAELRAYLREDAEALRRAYGTFGGLAKRTGGEIADLLAEQERKKGDESIRQAVASYARTEKALLSLLDGCRFPPGVREIPSDARYRDIITIKRSEMLGHLFSQLQGDRRNVAERRSMVERRTSSDGSRQGPERRSGKDRRNAGERRQNRGTSQ